MNFAISPRKALANDGPSSALGSHRPSLVHGFLVATLALASTVLAAADRVPWVNNSKFSVYIETSTRLDPHERVTFASNDKGDKLQVLVDSRTWLAYQENLRPGVIPKNSTPVIEIPAHTTLYADYPKAVEGELMMYLTICRDPKGAAPKLDATLWGILKDGLPVVIKPRIPELDAGALIDQKYLEAVKKDAAGVTCTKLAAPTSKGEEYGVTIEFK